MKAVALAIVAVASFGVGYVVHGFTAGGPNCNGAKFWPVTGGGESAICAGPNGAPMTVYHP